MMKTLAQHSRNTPESFYNPQNGLHYYPHPLGSQWDVIQSPSPRGRWNTSNLSLAVVSDLRVANFIAEQLAGTEFPGKA